MSLGTVSSGSINAHVISLDPQNSEYLLVFNRQLFDFTDMFARFIASQVADHISEYGQAPSQDRGVLADADCRLLGDLVYFLVNRVAFFRDDAGAVDLIIVVDIDQDPPLAKLTSELSKVFKELLYFSMTSFAVAHELAHIIRLNSKVELPDRGKEEDTNFDEETACDAMACRIAAQAAARQCVGKYAHGWQMVGTVGSLFFLSCLGLVEKAAYVLHHGTDVPQVMTEVNLTSLESNVIFSYPTAVFRRYVGRAVLEDEFRRAGAPELRDWIFGAHDWTAALFDQCWTKLQTRLAGGAEFRKKMRDHGETVRRERK